MTQQLLALRAAEPASPPALAARRGDASAAITTAAPPAPAEPVLPNPQLRLDAALGLVVLEFRDRGGQARTIPTERELDAYRSSARSSAPAEDTAQPVASAVSAEPASATKPEPAPKAPDPATP